MHSPRADSVVELEQLQRRFDHALHNGGQGDYAALLRECDRVIVLVPACDRAWARERIEQLRTRLVRAIDAHVAAPDRPAF